MATIDTTNIAGVGTVTIGVFTLDHCPPHATCRDGNRRWTVRINFSFIHNTVSLRDIIPPWAAPPADAVAQMENLVASNLRAYQEMWWNYQQRNPSGNTIGACCLDNQALGGGVVQSATFDPATGTTVVALSNGVTHILPP